MNINYDLEKEFLIKKEYTIELFNKILKLKSELYLNNNKMNQIIIYKNFKNYLKEFLFFENYSILFKSNDKVIQLKNEDFSYNEINDFEFKENLTNIKNQPNKLFLLKNEKLNNYFNNKDNYIVNFESFNYSDLGNEIYILFEGDNKFIKLYFN